MTVSIDYPDYQVEHNIPYRNHHSTNFDKIDINPYLAEWPKEYFDGLPMANSYGFRSDEFTDTHDGTHVLFAGCSLTFGMGLHRSEMWSTIVHDYVSRDNKTSGYFNISVFGSSIQYQVINIIKYCKTFGNPDFIFFRMPDLRRGYGGFKDEPYLSLYKKVPGKKFPKSVDYMLSITAFDYYMMLDQFCADNNIKLMSFSWDETVSKILSTQFNTFYSDHGFAEIVIEELDKHSEIDSKLKYTARDGSHPGIGPNLGYARVAINAYESLKDFSKSHQHSE